ncbi:MAG: Kelch repeat-containing protein [Paludibacteraceae bacterium]
MKKLSYIVCLFVVLCGCKNPDDIALDITECAPIPVGLASATAFTVGDEAYVFGGRNQDGIVQNRLWRYSAKTNQWTDLGETPLKARVRACACVVGESVYIGLGFNGRVYIDSCYLQDWWCYTPRMGTWERKADLNSRNTIGGIAYEVGGTIYVAYGSGRGFTRDIQLYDIAENTWTLQTDNWHRALSVLGPTGGKANERCFFGTGFSRAVGYNLNQWYEVDFTTDTWTKRDDIPHGKRSLATCAGNSRYIYIMGGRHFSGELTTGKIYADIERYSLAEDRWDCSSTMPYGAAENMVAFAIGETVYFGLGEDAQGNIHQTLYRIEQ